MAHRFRASGIAGATAIAEPWRGWSNIHAFVMRHGVLLAECSDWQRAASDNDEPSRNPIHTVVRAPNGNDYGRDLLRRHSARHHTVSTVRV